MYSSCDGKRCMVFLETIPQLFITNGKRIYVFHNKKNWNFLEEKKIPRDRETYGF